MSSKHIEELLQQCLTAFDAGLSPEECLSAFPAAREELEPLFRQAISLRVAFAAAPSPEFRVRARERVLFAAGRDVSAALAAQPDPEFVQDARQRFIRAAGLDAQEALREVPPPRLPFWLNARRRLLEAAAAPQPAPRRSSPMFGLRAGLSAAVVVLAVALAGGAYIAGIDSKPGGASAQLAQLDQDLREIERVQQSGGIVSAAALQELNDRTSRLLGELDNQQPSPAVVERLPELIDRQKTVVLAAANQGSIAPELAQAQAQQLAVAEKVVEDIKLAAAQAPTATVPAPVATATPETASPTPETTAVAAAPETSATAADPGDEPTAAATGAPKAGTVRVTALTGDTFGNQAWKLVETATFSIAVPASWHFSAGISLGADGTAEFEGSRLVLEGPSAGVIINVVSGQVVASIGTETINLRGSGANGELISIEALASRVPPALVGDLRHMLESLELIAVETPAPATATPSSTATPAPSSTPATSATP